MLSKFVSIFLLISVMSIRYSSAQGDDLVVLNPHQILYPTSKDVQELPVINVNNLSRTLFYFNPETRDWQTYDYPSGLDEIPNVAYYIRMRSDGTYLIETSGFWPFTGDNATTAWIFDPVQGVFSRPSSVCNGWVQALTGEGQWFILEETGQYRLCNTETGHRSPTIPSQIDDGACPAQPQKHIMVSPEKSYVLLFCGGTEFEALSYDISEQTFLKLGMSIARLNENVEVVRWLDDATAVIHAYPSWNPPANSYYVADVSQVGGLEFIQADLYDAPYYFDNPPRIEWMPCEFARCGVSEENGKLSAVDLTGRKVELGFHQYDFLTGKLNTYPALDGVLGMSVSVPDGSGDRIYRHLNYAEDSSSHTAPSATLIRFNYGTRQQTAIFSGEIEWIENFSPDGRYLALQMGDDGVIASSDLLAENQAGYFPTGRVAITILDLQTNAPVYHAEGGIWTQDDWWRGKLQLDWIDNHTFLIRGVDEKFDNVVQLRDSATTVAEFEPYSTTLSPEGAYILVRGDGSSISVYNIDNEDLETLAYSTLANYSVGASWYDDQSIILRISKNDVALARWLIALQ